ncbi:MAG: hypothetical protein AAGB46_13485, partial [Verrucomicrobiota bacterium]
HHNGKYIRLAYADQIAGPWIIYEPGTLHLHQAPAFIGHIASPDVHIDHQKREIRMYFHGSRETENQKTAFATSKNGIDFKAENQILGSAYFRVFKHQDTYYALDTHGYLNRSEEPNRNWSRHNRPLFPHATIEDPFGRRNDLRIRHSTIWIHNEKLYIFYTRKSDAPERILVSEVSLQGDWTQWEAGPAIEVLRPETEYEGIQYPIQPSKSGGGKHQQQLRDPYLFQDGEKRYLFYSIAGEMGLAVAEIKIQ